MRSKVNLREDSYQVLSDSGLKFTRQRALILKIIRQGRGHLDADEVYRRAREKEPRLSLSTVYRSLQKLKELGLVDELHFDENHHHYEVKSTSEHHHLMCLNCGQVIEIDYPLARYVKKTVNEAKDFDIIEAEVHMSGYCPKCRKEPK